MLIKTFELGPVATNGYLIWDDSSKEALLIDAPQGVYERVGAFLAENGLQLTGLLLTHGHWDHIADAWKFQKDQVPVWGNRGDQHFFDNPMIMSMAMPFGLEIRPVVINHYVDQGDSIRLIGKEIEVRYVPGHAIGSVLFYFKDEKKAFVGDAIFKGSIGRYDLPGGDFGILEHSIKTQIYTLPEDTQLFPGHGPTTTVGYEMKTNPFVRA